MFSWIFIRALLKFAFNKQSPARVISELKTTAPKLADLSSYLKGVTEPMSLEFDNATKIYAQVQGLARWTVPRIIAVRHFIYQTHQWFRCHRRIRCEVGKTKAEKWWNHCCTFAAIPRKKAGSKGFMVYTLVRCMTSTYMWEPRSIRAFKLRRE